MFSISETVLTEGDVFTMNALIDRFFGAYFSKLTSIAVIVILFPDLLVDELFFDHILFFFDLSDDLWCFFISAQRTFHNSIIFDFMFSPLTETIQMESVSTNSMTWGSGITFDYLHMTDRTKIIFVFILILLENDVSTWHFYFDVFKEILHLVVMDATICYDVSQLFVVVLMPEK